MNKLDLIIQSAQFWKEMFWHDLAIGIVDLEKYLYYTPGKTFDLGIKIGDPIKMGSAVHNAITKKRKVEVFIPEDVWGIPIKALSIPVLEQGEVIGALAVVFSVENEEKLKGIVNNFASSFNQAGASVKEISSSAQNLAENSEKIASSTTEVKEALDKTEDILKLIDNISKQTKLLGLNAAIEAARSGEHGKGFIVVAEEIRRLSDETIKSASQVKNIVAILRELVSTMINSIHEISAISEEQMAATEEVNALVEELVDEVQELEKFAKFL